MINIVYVFDLDDTLLSTQELFSKQQSKQLLSQLYYPPNNMDFRGTQSDRTQLAYNQIIASDPELIELFRHLYGHKYIFTNGTRLHAQCALHSLGISTQFKGQLDREGMAGKMKPDPNTFHLMQLALSAAYNQKPTILFLDDQLVNLKQAKEFGWTTVWISPSAMYRPLPAGIDYGFSNVNLALHFLIKSEIYWNSQSLR
jgi:HAD superfamily hydrolase (TIGR01509 family)